MYVQKLSVNMSKLNVINGDNKNYGLNQKRSNKMFFDLQETILERMGSRRLMYFVVHNGKKKLQMKISEFKTDSNLSYF